MLYGSTARLAMRAQGAFVVGLVLHSVQDAQRSMPCALVTPGCIDLAPRLREVPFVIERPLLFCPAVAAQDEANTREHSATSLRHSCR